MIAGFCFRPFWGNFAHDDPARHAEAVRWLKTAAAAGHPKAKAALRGYFEDDHPHDTPRIWMDAAEAEGWYREAAAHKIPTAAEPLLTCRRRAGRPTLRSAEYLKRAADEFQAARQSDGYGSHRACLAAGFDDVRTIID